MPIAGEVNAKVDDDGLAGGNAGGTGDINANSGEVGAGTASETVWTGTLQGSGGDAPTHFLFQESLESVHTATLSWRRSPTSYPQTTTLQAFVDGGARDGTLLFDIVINNASTGAYTLTLHENVLQTPGGNDETSAFLNVPYQIQDSDGDLASSPGTIHIEFNDDTPAQTSAVITAHVDEDELTGGNTDGDAQTTVATGSLSTLVSVGADQPGSFSFDASALGGLPALTSNGAAVHYAIVGGTLVAYTGGQELGPEPCVHGEPHFGRQLHGHAARPGRSPAQLAGQRR